MGAVDIDAIKARCEAATPGPWYAERGGEFDDPYYSIPSVCRDRYGDNSLMVGSDKATADFIAAARTDVPALVAEVERLRDELRHVERTRHSNRVLAAEVERLRGASA